MTMKTPDLKPCRYCGAEETSKVATTDYVEIMCCGCGATVKEYGKTRRYDSIANCLRYVMPKAIESWNRRANDDRI